MRSSASTAISVQKPRCRTSRRGAGDRNPRLPRLRQVEAKFTAQPRIASWKNVLPKRFERITVGSLTAGALQSAGRGKSRLRLGSRNLKGAPRSSIKLAKVRANEVSSIQERNLPCSPGLAGRAHHYR